MATADLEKLELHNGDRMTQPEFHRIYEQMPEDFRAELIGGIVYVASPLRISHGNNHMPLSSLFFAYESDTPGVQSGDNVTIILGKKASRNRTFTCASSRSLAASHALRMIT